MLKSFPKRLLGLTLLAVLLNAALLLIPSILFAYPSLVLEDTRLAAFIVIVTGWIMLESVASHSSSSQQDSKTSSGCLVNLMSAAVLALFLVSLMEQSLTGIQPFTIASLLGLVLMVIGIGLRFAAIHSLASYFLDDVIVVSGQTLVTSGIYAYIRHPSELGNLCIAFGCPVLLGSTSGLLLSSLFLLPIVLLRIHLEDKLLRHHFPEHFPDYSCAVPALLPWRLPQKPS
jgi:protein-S-isoprenylcysteine O-methyltransferase Ste14